MADVTRILCAIEAGDPSAAEKLLPLVYEELRRLAAHKMAHEPAGHTLQATALVHEAYLRLVDVEKSRHWNSRGHFFAAAAEAMRRILVERARGKKRPHAIGLLTPEMELEAAGRPEELFAVDEALERLEAVHPQAACLVKLRYFVGFTIPEASDSLGISPRKANQLWAYARAWLLAEIPRNRES
ncbi:MAG: ECF-type sigma factor [Planctomycetaceae bacterium]